MYHILREAEYNESALHSGRKVFLRVTFTTLSPYVIIDNENIQSVTLSEIVNNTQETLTMGCSCSNKIEINFIQDPMNKILDRIGTLEGKYITVECGLEVAEDDIVYASLGHFIISDVKINDNDNTVFVTAYDGITRLNQPYSPTVDLTTASLQDVYDDLSAQILDQLGMVLKERTIPDDEAYTVVQIAQDDTLLGTLNYVAGMLGGFARVDRDGEIEICSCLDTDSKWYEDTGIVIDRDIIYADGLNKLTNHTKKITYIESGTNGFEIASGSELPGAKIWFECPYMTQGAMDNIFSVVENLEYQPCEIKWIGDPLVQAGDKVTVFFNSSNETTVDADEFAEQVSDSGKYVFTYNGTQWEYNEEEVTLGNYGITITHQNPIENDRIVVEFFAGTTPKAKCKLYYQKNVLIMESVLTVDGGISNDIFCYGQTVEDADLNWNYESASNNFQKMYNSLRETILEITSNMTGAESGYVILHKRGDKVISSSSQNIKGAVSVNSAYFADNFHIEGQYRFDYNGEHWTYENAVVDISSVGITLKKEPIADDYIIVNLSFTAEYPDEILVADNQSIMNSRNIWRFNQNGLAHSSSGYDGPYTTAITQDGKIVGSFIQANSISLNAIRPEAVQEITSNLVNKAIFNEFSDSVYQSIQEAESNAVSQATDELTEYKNKVAQYLTFNGDNGLIIGALNSNFKTNLTNNKLSFIDNEEEVAYISNKEFFITNGNILSRLNIGNFKFVPRSNGNLSLVYEEVVNS